MHYISICYAETDAVCVCTVCIHTTGASMCVVIVYIWCVLYSIHRLFMVTLSHVRISSVTWQYKNTDNKNLYNLRPARKTGVRKETWITDTADKAQVAISRAKKPAQHHGTAIHGEPAGSFSFWTTKQEEIPIFSTTESYFQMTRMPALVFHFSKHRKS